MPHFILHDRTYPKRDSHGREKHFRLVFFKQKEKKYFLATREM